MEFLDKHQIAIFFREPIYHLCAKRHRTQVRGICTVGINHRGPGPIVTFPACGLTYTMKQLHAFMNLACSHPLYYSSQPTASIELQLRRHCTFSNNEKPICWHNNKKALHSFYVLLWVLINCIFGSSTLILHSMYTYLQKGKFTPLI